MPQIVPIQDLKNTSEISRLCHAVDEPVFVTDDGSDDDMVIMSMDVYERDMLMQDVYRKIEEAEEDIAHGRVKDAKEALNALRAKYGI